MKLHVFTWSPSSSFVLHLYNPLLWCRDQWTAMPMVLGGNGTSMGSRGWPCRGIATVTNGNGLQWLAIQGNRWPWEAPHGHAMTCHDMAMHGMSSHSMACQAMACQGIPCHSMPCHALQCVTVDAIADLQKTKKVFVKNLPRSMKSPAPHHRLQSLSSKKPRRLARGRKQ